MGDFWNLLSWKAVDEIESPQMHAVADKTPWNPPPLRCLMKWTHWAGCYRWSLDADGTVELTTRMLMELPSSRARRHDGTSGPLQELMLSTSSWTTELIRLMKTPCPTYAADGALNALSWSDDKIVEKVCSFRNSRFGVAGKWIAVWETSDVWTKNSLSIGSTTN